MSWKERKAEVEEEARETWNLGLKLGLTRREDENSTRHKLEKLITQEAARKKKGSKKAKENIKGKI